MTALIRKVPMVAKPRQPKRPRDTGPSAKTRDAVYARSEMRCERCGSSDGPYAVHHRSGRRMGSTRRPEKNALSNLVLVDDRCHAWAESYRADAELAGWIVRSHDIPADIPILRCGEWVTLDDNGGYSRVEC